jgi:protein involved in polysaccharide export with SLBB domain
MELSVAMKRIPLIIVLLLMVPHLVAAQGQLRERRSADREPSTGDSTSIRNRTVNAPRSNHVESDRAESESKPVPVSDGAPQSREQERPRWGNASVEIRPSVIERPPASQRPIDSTLTNNVQDNSVAKKLVQKTAMVTETQASLQPPRSNVDYRPSSSSRALPPTSLYRVGIGDVLDIRLSNQPTRESTLFTVLKDGGLEYPLLNGPIAVTGLTTDEIARRLSSEIKVIQSARVSVSVRDFASHAVVVTGLVDNPGRKLLRREAMPLYAVLAEALPRPEAVVATIVHGDKDQTVSLSDNQGLSMLVLPGDAVRVSGSAAMAKHFIYVGGDVTSPGEKEFRDGMTLTQAVMSAGGISRSGKTSVRVSRRNHEGFLTASEYNLRSIEEGKSQDPLLQAGDRIEVIQSM